MKNKRHLHLVRHFAIRFGRAYKTANPKKVGVRKLIKAHLPDIWTDEMRETNYRYARAFNIALKYGYSWGELTKDIRVIGAYWR